MRTTNLPHRFAALTIAAAAVLGLAGCTGISSGSATPAPEISTSESDGTAEGTQTTAEACALVNDIMTEATAEFENMDPNDPDAVVQGMEAAVQSLDDAAAQVTNEEVAAILPELQDMFQQVGDLMTAIIDGDTGKLAELEEVAGGFQETALKFQELCAPTE